MPSSRLYIRGLDENIGESDIKDRFAHFGTVSDVSVARDAYGGCRGFAHLTLNGEENTVRKCISSLSGSSWKGKRLKIEEARPSYTEKLKAQEDGECKAEISTEYKRRLVRHAKDMSLVTDKNVESRKGWRRGKFGRPIAIVKIRKLDGSLVVMDPSHDPNALEKFYEGYHPRPVSRLTWFSSEKWHTLQEVYQKETVEEHEDITLQMQSEYHPVAAAPTWEAAVTGGSFSLAAALNLPIIEATPEPVESPKMPEMKSLYALSEASAFDMNKLFMDFEQFYGHVKARSHLFTSVGPKAEGLLAWKQGRSDIRKDFKKQSKAAKRQLRKKKLLQAH